MQTLAKELRRQLERTVIEARDVAEAGARSALEALAVHHNEPYGHMNAEQRTLRNRLRAHARHIGDRVDARTGAHTIEHLVHECAYEHWHGMVFARFLAENDLLIEPKLGIAITLGECEDLAKEEGVDKWTLAARFAHQLLPQVFRPDHPVFAVQFAREHRLKLESLVEDIPSEAFVATDSLGWVYQFWQTKKKGEVNAAGNKVGADELPSVTQLFTEDYMVDFLLDNTLGAWHAGKVLTANPELSETVQDEDKLREAVSLPGSPWKYLRFIRSEDGQWTPAAGTFDGWPRSAKGIKCLDPCMGSGHFVVAMFERLVALRMAEETLDEVAAVAAVIRDNLFGLEIDPRCTQIGAFNLALASWRRIGHRPLPAMNLACSGLAPNAREADWLAIAGDKEKLRNGMERLYGLFQKAAALGSLINPRDSESDLFVAEFHELQPLLEKALAQENKDEAAHEMAVTAQGIAKAAEILADQFTLVATNVPYLKRGNQDEPLLSHSRTHFSDSSACLSTTFVERCIGFCTATGTFTAVTPQPWLFLQSYKIFRKMVLKEHEWNLLARLGHSAFETITGHVVDVVLLTLTAHGSGRVGWFLDCDQDRTPNEKALGLTAGELVKFDQSAQINHPESRVVFGDMADGKLINELARSVHGQGSFDDPSFVRQFWEFPWLFKGWVFQQTSSNSNAIDAGLENVFLWQDGVGRLAELMELKAEDGYTTGKWKAGQSAWGKRGVSVCGMGNLYVNRYSGGSFDTNVAVVYPESDDHFMPLWCYCRSPEFIENVRKIDRKPKVTPNTFGKVPFDIERWKKVADEEYPHGLPKPFSTDPTQWLFNGHPSGADQPLQVAVTRLLGYQWPRQTGSSFPDCRALGPDGLDELADGDGIVCIPSVRGERPASDRLLQLLHAAYRDDWHDGILTKLIAEPGSASLDDWLRNGFFEQHCKLFHHRPFIWHIWDGRKNDGFHALINYHKLAEGDGNGRRLLESLTYSYLGDWIGRQQDGVKRGAGGAEDRLAAATELQKRLIAILEGEPPFDLFIRWKPIEEQPIGWEPDINDGVRLNIRPFMIQDLHGGKKGAGVLRTRPNIHWKKDRGKEPAREQTQYPWFWNSGKFTGERVNDMHLTIAEKRTARDLAREKR